MPTFHVMTSSTETSQSEQPICRLARALVPLVLSGWMVEPKYLSPEMVNGYAVQGTLPGAREPNEIIFVVLKALMENKTPLKPISEAI